MQNGLTLAIPYYSGKHFLARTIESVLAQSSGSWNLVVCDDSPLDDGIGELVGAYRDGRIRYRRNAATLGLAGNWNACLDEAQADLVTILHADDELLKPYCNVMLAAAHDFPHAVGYCCEATIIDELGKKCFSFPDRAKRRLRPKAGGPVELSGPTAVARLLRGNFIICPTVCYRRSALGSRRFDDRWRFALDLEFFARLLLDGDTLLVLPDVAYAYRRHRDSATAQQTKTLHRFTEEIELYEHLARIGEAGGWPELEAVGRKKRIVALNLAYCATKDLLGLKLRDAGRKLALWRNLHRESKANSAGNPRPPAGEPVAQYPGRE